MHISSFLILCKPAERRSVADAVAALPGLTVCDGDGGRIVALAEGACAPHISDALETLQAVRGVIAVNLVYHGVADDDGADATAATAAADADGTDGTDDTDAADSIDTADAAGDKVPSASPTDMSSLDSRFRGNDGAVVVNGGATDGNRAAVVGTVATVGGGVGDGAVATRDAGLRPLRPSFNGNDGVGSGAVAVGDAHVRPVADGAMFPDDATHATGSNTHKSSFPRTRESRTNNPAKPTEFNADDDTGTTAADSTNTDGIDTADAAADDKVPSASPTDMFSLDSRVRGNDGAVVVGGGDDNGDRAAATTADATLTRRAFIQAQAAAVALSVAGIAHAAEFHERMAREQNLTCIDCHKGIAHDLPDMAGVGGWQ